MGWQRHQNVFWCNISNMRRSVSSPDETPRRELKIAGDETLCRMFDISAQTKSFLKEKLRMQK